MRKLVAVVFAAALVGCNDVLDPGPMVLSTHDGTPTVVAYTGMVRQVPIDQFVIEPDVDPGVVRLVGHEDQLIELVGHQAYVAGTMGNDGALHVTECHGTEGSP